MPTYWVSMYSWMPSAPPSRPKPLAFIPPNGAAALLMTPRLRPTIPASSDPHTRIARSRSRVKT